MAGIILNLNFGYGILNLCYLPHEVEALPRAEVRKNEKKDQREIHSFFFDYHDIDQAGDQRDGLSRMDSVWYTATGKMGDYSDLLWHLVCRNVPLPQDSKGEI